MCMRKLDLLQKDTFLPNLPNYLILRYFFGLVWDKGTFGFGGTDVLVKALSFIVSNYLSH